MALEILKDLKLNLEDLVEELSVLKDKVKQVKEFLDYANQQTELQRVNPKSYILRLDDVEERATSLAKALRDYYMPGQDVLKQAEQAAKAAGPKTAEAFQLASKQGKEVIEMVRQLTGKQFSIPNSVVEFVDHAIKVLEEGRVSVFACKRPVTDLGVTFDQLAGLKAEKEQLRVGYIYPNQYKGLFGGGVSRGVLMFGPPGTGKTLLAKAATSELSDTAFFTATPGEIKGKYVGETEKRIRELFVCAGEFLERKSRRYKSAVIFMDEFDGLAADRESGPNAGDSVNEFLQNMDGLKSNAKVSVLAATNYPWSIDDAILRRFDTRVFVDLPDRLARMSIILTELAKAYALPGSDPKQSRVYVVSQEGDEIQWSQAVTTLFINLVEYGGRSSKRIVGASAFRSGKEEQFIETLDVQDIVWLTEATGPKPTSKDIVGREEETEYSEKAVHPYGYSSSDVSKVIKKAITLASVRIVQQRTVKNLYSEMFVDHRTGEEVEYFVYDLTGKKNVTKSLADLEKEGRAHLAVNFSIFREDLEKAQRMFSSTIDPDKYKQMKDWVKKNASS